MPFQYILANLLAESPEGVGAIFLDDTGETVDLASVEYAPYDMQVLGAQLGIHLRHISELMNQVDLGATEVLHIERFGLHLHVAALSEGYSLVLLQRRPGQAGAARNSLRRAAEQLEQELFSG